MIGRPVDRTRKIRDQLRQMIAVLESERQALADLDLDAILMVTAGKDQLCDALSETAAIRLDDETRALAETAQRLNEVNRRVRNLLAANVATRLEALGGRRPSYQPVSATSGQG